MTDVICTSSSATCAGGSAKLEAAAGGAALEAFPVGVIVLKAFMIWLAAAFAACARSALCVASSALLALGYSSGTGFQ